MRVEYTEENDAVFYQYDGHQERVVRKRKADGTVLFYEGESGREHVVREKDASGTWFVYDRCGKKRPRPSALELERERHDRQFLRKTAGPRGLAAGREKAKAAATMAVFLGRSA